MADEEVLPTMVEGWHRQQAVEANEAAMALLDEAMTGRERMRVGLIGVGAIGSCLVEAIMTGPRAESVDFFLSPRSVGRSAELAQRYPHVAVVRSNQEVVDRCELVLIGVLPEQVDEVCSQLHFRDNHLVAGLAAGWPPSLLGPRVWPAARVCQLIPLPMVSLHAGADRGVPCVARAALAAHGMWRGDRG